MKKYIPFYKKYKKRKNYTIVKKNVKKPTKVMARARDYNKIFKVKTRISENVEHNISYK